MNPFHIVGGLLFAAAVAGGAFAVRAYNSAIEENAKLKSDLQIERAEKAAAIVARDAIQKEKERLQAMVDYADELAKQARQREAEERARNEKLSGDLRELAKREKAVKDWADGLIPESVRRLRRDTGTDHSNGLRRTPGLPDSDQPAKPDATPPPERPHKWRLGSRIEGEPFGGDFLQSGQSGYQSIDRKEPETMKTTAMLFAALIVAFALEAEAQQQPSQLVQPVTLQASETNFYDAISTIAGPGADGETKRLALFAATIVKVKDGGNTVTAVNQQQLQQQQAMMTAPKAGRTVWDLLWDGAAAIADRTFTTIERVAPAGFSYASQRHATKANVQLGEINARLGERQSDNFLALGVAGIEGTTRVANAGFQTIGLIPHANTYQISGDANFGSGQLWRNSGNRNCVGGSAAPGGSSTGTTGTVSGGSGAPGGGATC